ncbi:hypothetical protein O6H91_Y581800 [Diphasiastrum complanatum]|nr:hypothetical protein O6H91_Y581800 [Diphasiastrum complanatum]
MIHNNANSYFNTVFEIRKLNNINTNIISTYQIIIIIFNDVCSTNVMFSNGLYISGVDIPSPWRIFFLEFQKFLLCRQSFLIGFRFFNHGLQGLIARFPMAIFIIIYLTFKVIICVINNVRKF